MKLSDLTYFEVRKGYNMDDFVRNHKSVSITFSVDGIYRHRITWSFSLEAWANKRLISHIMLNLVKSELQKF